MFVSIDELLSRAVAEIITEDEMRAKLKLGDPCA
jgi:hypothetical protein